MMVALGGKFSRTPADPGAESGGVVRRDPLTDERSQQSTEDVPHPTAGHARVTSGVKQRRLAEGCDHGAGTFEQQRHVWIRPLCDECLCLRPAM